MITKLDDFFGVPPSLRNTHVLLRVITYLFPVGVHYRGHNSPYRVYNPNNCSEHTPVI